MLHLKTSESKGIRCLQLLYEQDWSSYIKDEFLQERDSFTEDDANSDCCGDDI